MFLAGSAASADRPKYPDVIAFRGPTESPHGLDLSRGPSGEFSGGLLSRWRSCHPEPQ
jgi:hypothetical protein